jgi:ABC-type uncharacterized transport system involved in gliding motility auxiliary subunit
VKTLAPNLKTHAKYLFWLGPILIVIGLSAGLVSGTWGALPLGLLIAGLVTLGLWLLFQARLAKGFWGRRSTQVGTNAIVSTLAFLVILGLINFLVVRYPARIDLTEKQFFSLAPQSQQVLSHLQQPVKVLIFDNAPDPATRTLLEQYQRQGQPFFSFELIDPQAKPGLAQKYGVKNPGEVFLESGKRVQPLESALAETSLTPAIARVVSDRQSKSYFTQGHGELLLESGQGSLSEAVKALKGKDITPEPLNLLEQRQVPQDANLVVIASPKRPFLAAEVQMLKAYLKRNGSLLLMVDPETKPGLDSLLKDWGVQFDNRLVVDASGTGQLLGLGPAVPVVNHYGDHPITKDFAQGVSFYPLAQAIVVKQLPAQQVTALVVTGDQSWAETDPNNAELQFNPGRDRKGPLVLGVAISRPGQPEPTAATSQAKAMQSRLVILGDSDFATDGTFDKGVNGDVFLNTVTWLSDRPDQVLSIRPKEPTNRRLEITAERSRLVTLLGLGILPLAAFGTAAGLWWQRR